jgi:phosphotransacetylase
MVALGDADAMVTGIARKYSTALIDVRHVIEAKPAHRVIGVSIAPCLGRTVIVADTAVYNMPDAEQIGTSPKRSPASPAGRAMSRDARESPSVILLKTAKLSI